MNLKGIWCEQSDILTKRQIRKIRDKGYNLVYLFKWDEEEEWNKRVISLFANSNFAVFLSVDAFRFKEIDYESRMSFYTRLVDAATTPNVDGIVLDFIRFSNPGLHDFRVINKEAAYASFVCYENKKEMHMTNIFPPFFYGQNPFSLRKYGVLAPMLYDGDKSPEFSGVKIWLISKFYKFLSKAVVPCIQGWQTLPEVQERTIKLLEKCGIEDYSIFRYGLSEEFVW